MDNAYLFIFQVSCERGMSSGLGVDRAADLWQLRGDLSSGDVALSPLPFFRISGLL